LISDLMVNRVADQNRPMIGVFLFQQLQ
jgi:hypothetical protein